MNGYKVMLPLDEQIATVKLVASSEMTEDEWTAWVERNVEPIPVS